MNPVLIEVSHSNMESSRVWSVKCGMERREEKRGGEGGEGGGGELTEEGSVACSMMEIKNRWSFVAGMN